MKTKTKIIHIVSLGSEFIKTVLYLSKLEVLICSRQKSIRTLKLLIQLRTTFSMRYIVQMESIKYEEYALAAQLNLRLIPFDFVEQDGSNNKQSIWKYLHSF